jgi:hypothetical protein
MQPFIELIPAQTFPTPPAGTKPGWVSGPDTFDQRELVPVLRWAEYVYWTFDYIDNRNAFALVAYDHYGNMVKQWEKQGPRYIWDVTLERAKKTLTFFGQANEKLDVTLDELCISDRQYYSLYPPPVVSFIPLAQAPAVPAGLYSTWQLESNTTARQTGIPVLSWGDYTYRVYEHPDNRLTFAIIAFNQDGKIVKDWEIHGLRYITDIAVDLLNKRINFTGQGPKIITYTWDDLKITEPDANDARFSMYAQMALKDMPLSSAPTPPAGLITGWTTGPNSHVESKHYTVLLYNGYTYWVFDYSGNIFSIGILAYNSEGKLVKQWRKDGTRYLWSVSLDPRRKTVTFWGQANKNVVVGWDELIVD